MDERTLLRHLLRLTLRETAADSERAKNLETWYRSHAATLGLPVLEDPPQDETEEKTGLFRRFRAKPPATEEKPDGWTQFARAVNDEPAGDDPAGAAPKASLLLVIAERVAALLKLAERDALLLQIVVAVERLRPSGSLCNLLQRNGMDVSLLIAELAGFDSLEALRQTQAVQLGLVELTSNREGQVSVEATHSIHRVLNRSPMSDEAIIECLVGKAAPARLALSDFALSAELLSLLRRMLGSALGERLAGINILLYGPPGTGKTELAKSLAAAAGARLYAVGETDNYGDEPDRYDRVAALALAQQVLGTRGDVVLLFDEMEDLIGDARRVQDSGQFVQRPGSKVYVNRLFETNAVPTIWTTNAIENIDPAFLRRMSFVLKMDLPSPAARKRILGRIAADEGLALSPATIDRLAGSAAEATTVARNALRTASLLKGDETEAGQLLESLVTGVRHGRRLPPAKGSGTLNLDLYRSETPIGPLFDKLTQPDAPDDFSLLLSGPPGTGKTALAHHLAQRLDRPLTVKRASDLLSKWIGDTEKGIAEAFAQAAEDGSVLLFDEVDSLLFDRGKAERNWEVSQVNELLTWMDNHPLPFIAATNYAARLDSAALRRFVFKVKLEALDSAGAQKAFEVFFDRPAPPRLAEIAGLTPGDFAVVARQLRFQAEEATPEAIVELLAREAAAKPGTPGRIGFRLAPAQ